jgi:putative hydrolase of the HAD superfamily
MAEAIVFDLFHTLVDTEHLRPPGFRTVESIGRVIGIDAEGLAAFWRETYVERETTEIDVVQLVERHCEPQGINLSGRQRQEIDALFGMCRDEALLSPRTEIVDMLAWLSERCRIGVLSNCDAREVRAWLESPLAPFVEVFARSCEIGAMKPDPGAYQWLLDAMAVKAQRSVYVGNGGSDELLGARRGGFGTVVHCNIFDSSNGIVSVAEQRVRAAQADVSVSSADELTALLHECLLR